MLSNCAFDFYLRRYTLTDPQLTRAAPVSRMPSMVTLTPHYEEDIAFSAEDLRQAVDGENVSTLRFIISMVGRCRFTLSNPR
jgi:hypothetical protein